MIQSFRGYARALQPYDIPRPTYLIPNELETVSEGLQLNAQPNLSFHGRPFQVANRASLCEIIA